MRPSSASPCPTFRAHTARCCSRRRCRAWRRLPTPFSGSRASEVSESIEVRAPAEQTEGTRSQILRWLKQVGDRVTENEPLIEIETDKVTVEVAAPGSGVLREILRHEEEEITPGELLGWLDAEGKGAGDAIATARSAGDEARTGGQAGVGAAMRSAAAPAASVGAARELSPAVRRLLAEHGLEATAVHGTGQGGRVTVEDVLRTAAGGARSASRTAPAAAPAAAPIASEPGGASEAGVRRVPHNAI